MGPHLVFGLYLLRVRLTAIQKLLLEPLSHQLEVLCGGRRTFQKSATNRSTERSCFDCNDERVKIAHGRLEPRADGSVEIVHVKVDSKGIKGRDPIIWSPSDWIEKTKKLTKLAEGLRSLQQELKTIKIPIPTESTLGWLTSGFDQGPIIHRQRMSPALLAAISGPQGWSPGPPPDDEQPKK